MIILLNNTKKGENPLILTTRYLDASGAEIPRSESANAVQAKFDVTCGDDYSFTLMSATSPKIIHAASKRFLSGVSRLKVGVTYHEFFVDEEVVVIDRPNKGANCPNMEEAGISLTTVPFKQKARTPEQKTCPMRAIVVVSDVKATVKARMNNQTNYSEKTTFVNGPYQYDIFLIRWSGWKQMQYRAALLLEVDGETSVYELGYVENATTKYCKDCLVKLNPQGVIDFLAYEKELDAKLAAKAAAADAEKNVKRYPDPNGKKPYNGNQKGKKPNYNNNRKPSNQKTGSYNKNTSGGRPNNTGYRKPNSNGGGYKRPQGNGSYKTNYGQKSGYKRQSK